MWLKISTTLRLEGVPWAPNACAGSSIQSLMILPRSSSLNLPSAPLFNLSKVQVLASVTSAYAPLVWLLSRSHLVLVYPLIRNLADSNGSDPPSILRLQHWVPHANGRGRQIRPSKRCPFHVQLTCLKLWLGRPEQGKIRSWLVEYLRSQRHSLSILLWQRIPHWCFERVGRCPHLA